MATRRNTRSGPSPEELEAQELAKQIQEAQDNQRRAQEATSAMVDAGSAVQQSSGETKDEASTSLSHALAHAIAESEAPPYYNGTKMTANSMVKGDHSTIVEDQRLRTESLARWTSSTEFTNRAISTIDSKFVQMEKLLQHKSLTDTQQLEIHRHLTMLELEMKNKLKIKDDRFTVEALQTIHAVCCGSDPGTAATATALGNITASIKGRKPITTGMVIATGLSELEVLSVTNVWECFNVLSQKKTVSKDDGSAYNIEDQRNDASTCTLRMLYECLEANKSDKTAIILSFGRPMCLLAQTGMEPWRMPSVKTPMTEFETDVLYGSTSFHHGNTQALARVSPTTPSGTNTRRISFRLCDATTGILLEGEPLTYGNLGIYCHPSGNQNAQTENDKYRSALFFRRVLEGTFLQDEIEVRVVKDDGGTFSIWQPEKKEKATHGGKQIKGKTTETTTSSTSSTNNEEKEESPVDEAPEVTEIPTAKETESDSATFKRSAIAELSALPDRLKTLLQHNDCTNEITVVAFNVVRRIVGHLEVVCNVGTRPTMDQLRVFAAKCILLANDPATSIGNTFQTSGSRAQQIIPIAMAFGINAKDAGIVLDLMKSLDVSKRTTKYNIWKFIKRDSKSAFNEVIKLSRETSVQFNHQTERCVLAKGLLANLLLQLSFKSQNMVMNGRLNNFKEGKRLHGVLHGPLNIGRVDTLEQQSLGLEGMQQMCDGTIRLRLEIYVEGEQEMYTSMLFSSECHPGAQQIASSEAMLLTDAQLLRDMYDGIMCINTMKIMCVRDGQNVVLRD